jgi:NADH:ubiquinone oxidoreductase subunit 3 (subunit A)
LPYRNVKGAYFNLLLLFVLLISCIFIFYIAIPYKYNEIVCIIVLLRHSLILFVTLTYLMIHGGEVWNASIFGIFYE